MKSIFSRRFSLALLTCLSIPAANAGLFDIVNDSVIKSVTEAVTGQEPAPAKQPPTSDQKAAELAQAIATNPQEALQQALFGESYVVYKGYARRYLPIKQLIFDGGLEQAVSYYESNGKTQIAPAEAHWTAAEPSHVQLQQPGQINLRDNSLKFLNQLELGAMQLDSGRFLDAIKNLQKAQKIVEKRENKSVLSGFGGKILSGGASVLGLGDHTPYYGEGFEKVLMLNYQSLGYLLDGNRNAYNVGRMAMDWQLREERKFLDNVSKVNKQLAKTGQSNSWEKSGLAKKYEPYEVRAKRVASAFVNPFGWYIAGLIQEFDSYGDRSTWSNAHNAYKKALELTPDNKMIANIIETMGQRSGPKTGSNLLHIVVSDGFAPEKKVLVSNLTLAHEVIPLEIPLYQPVTNNIGKIVLQSSSGKTLATLSEIADIEALAMRHQKDSQPMRKLTIALSILRATAQTQMESRSQIGGLFSKASKKLEIQSPDTRSWMSLPSRMMAARIHLKPGTKRVQLVTYNQQGKVVSRTPIEINPSDHNFIYGRNMGPTMQAYRTESLWI